MMRKLVMLGAVALLAAPAALAYKLVPQGRTASVAKGAIKVTPSINWNRLGARPGRFAESWTLDGLTLNDVTFYGGIPDDTTLFRDSRKREAPLPRFSRTMLAPDVAQLFEGSYRVAIGTPLFRIERVEPATFAGRPGFRFAYRFTVQSEEVERRGEAAGAIIDGRLYLISYEAPTIYYFDRDLANYRAIVASAAVGLVKAAK